MEKVVVWMTAVESEKSKLRRREVMALGVVLLCALALRLYRLEYHSLWSDELTTWWDVWRPTFSEFWQRYVSIELTPPLFFFLEFLVARVAPAAEWSLRLVSVVAGVGFVGAMYLFGAQLRGRWAGVIAASFAAFSFRAILFSQEARSYSLLLCLAALSGWAFLRLAAAPEPGRLGELGPGARRREAALYWAICVAMAYTHYFGVLLIIAQAVSALWVRPLTRATVWAWVKIYALILIAYLPWLWLITHTPLPETSLHKQVPWSEFFVAHRELFGSSAVNSTLAIVLAGVAVWAGGARQWRRESLAVLSWVFLVFAFALLVSNSYRPVWGLRNYMIALPPMLAVAAAGAFDLKRRRLVAFVAVLFVALEIHETFFARKFYFQPRSDQVREAIEASVPILREHPQASYILTGLIPYQPSIYLERFHAPHEFSTVVQILWQLNDPAYWSEEMKASSEWLVLAFADDPALVNDSLQKLSGLFDIGQRQEFNHATVVLLSRKKN